MVEKTILDRLRDLTHKLTKVVDMPMVPGNGYSEIKMEIGTCLGWKILEEKNMGIHRWFLSKGTVFPNHIHEGNEVIICYGGKLTFYKDSEAITLLPGDSIHFKPKEPHSLIVEEDSWELTITIPVDKGFPK